MRPSTSPRGTRWRATASSSCGRSCSGRRPRQRERSAGRRHGSGRGPRPRRRPRQRLARHPLRGAADGCAAVEGARTGSAVEGVAEAVRFGPAAPQRPNPSVPLAPGEPGGPRMDEDCLFLNVVRPSARSGLRSPATGDGLAARRRIRAGRIQPARLSRRRSGDRRRRRARHAQLPAGRAGFPRPGRGRCPGAETNVALRDVLLALHWVRDNIRAFGGDPRRRDGLRAERRRGTRHRPARLPGGRWPVPPGHRAEPAGRLHVRTRAVGGVAAPVSSTGSALRRRRRRRCAGFRSRRSWMRRPRSIRTSRAPIPACSPSPRASAMICCPSRRCACSARVADSRTAHHRHQPRRSDTVPADAITPAAHPQRIAEADVLRDARRAGAAGHPRGASPAA